MKYLFLLAFSLLSNLVFAQTMNTDDPSQNAGKVAWAPRMIEIDTLIPFGIPVTRNFVVENHSKEDLLITKVNTGCVCTTADYTQVPVPPKKGGVISVTYDAQKAGDFYRVIMVTTNFDPGQPVALILKGTVAPMK